MPARNTKSIFMISDFKIFSIKLLKQLYFGILSHTRENTNRGGWEHGISRAIEERICKFQGLIKKEVEFLGMLKKNSCGISTGLSF